MRTNNTLQPEKKDSSNNKIDDPESKKETEQTFLYIGKNLHKTKNCLSFFNNCAQAINFSIAKELLKEQFLNSTVIADLIIIDLPVNKEKITDFINWVKLNQWSAHIPIIHEEDGQNFYTLNNLLQQKLIDDVVNIESYCSKLHEKATFLKKAKLYLNNRILTHSDESSFTTKINKSGNLILKRFIDIFIASTALIILSPLLILIILIIKVESKGPAIYKSRRAGKGFKIFNFYKFRSMVADADQKVAQMADLNIYDKEDNAPAFFKVVNDPRITKVGSFLRNTSLDELPQLLNVLKGEMSIVGNRPLPLYEASTLTSDKYAERFMAPAGITGLWQITKRGSAEMSSEERLSLDINYARNNNILRDFRILLHTPLALLQKTNV